MNNVAKAMESKIKQTTNYSQFKLIASNRDVNKNHLRRLKESITARNFLYLFPIIINSDGEIVDGQHRLAAARELNTPIYYIVDDKITKADIAMVNSNRKGWSAMDYIEFYAKEGNPSYKKLISVLNKYHIPKMAAIVLISDNCSYFDTHGSKASSLYKTGNINHNHFAIAIKVLEWAEKLSKHHEYAMSRDFLIPVKSLVAKKLLGVDDTLKKIESNLPLDIEDLPFRLSKMRIELEDNTNSATSHSARKIEPIAPPQEKRQIQGQRNTNSKGF